MIFLTGGTGFLGMHLLQTLAESGETIRALKRAGSNIPFSGKLTGNVEWVDGDLLDISSLEEHMEGCSYVYHCAGLVSFKKADRNRLMKVNVEGTANVVNMALAKNIQKLVYVSSVSAIGRPAASNSISESTEWDFNGNQTNYGISKYLAEREVWRGIAEGLNAVIINPSVIIGDGNWKKGTPRFFYNSWKGMPFYMAGSTGFVAVADVVALMVLLMKSEISSERFIINAENRSYKDFLGCIADAMGRKRPSTRVSTRLAQLITRFDAICKIAMPDAPMLTSETARIAGLSYSFSAEKVKAATGYTFMPLKTCIEQTAKKFMEDYLAQNPSS